MAQSQGQQLRKLGFFQGLTFTCRACHHNPSGAADALGLNHTNPCIHVQI
jgi:hypothetical protein